jgi:hypothetical protein
MTNKLIIDKKFFDENGFLIVKHVFSPSEIADFRKRAYEQYALDQQKKLDFQLPNLAIKARFAKGDLLSKELLHQILLDDRIITIARTILGSNDLIYFGDSSYQIGTGLRGFHRDNIDRTDLNGADWKGEYSIIRLGIYLQDHKHYSGGLKIKAGTHKNKDGQVMFVDSEIGDVVLWSLKTIHSGNAVRLKFFPNYSINTSGKENMVPSFLKKDEQQERISLFMTFALKSAHLDRYLNEYIKKRPEMQEHIKASVHTPEALTAANKKNVQVLNSLNLKA